MTNGAGCSKCGLSHRNSVHTNTRQYGFHPYTLDEVVDRERAKFPRTYEAVQAVTDPEARYALETLLEELSAL